MARKKVVIGYVPGSRSELDGRVLIDLINKHFNDKVQVEVRTEYEERRLYPYIIINGRGGNPSLGGLEYCLGQLRSEFGRGDKINDFLGRD